MAIGKCWEDPGIDPGRVEVGFGGMEVYPTPLGEAGLGRLAAIMRAGTVVIDVRLGTGTAEATVWGCDLTSEYVHINADYTT